MVKGKRMILLYHGSGSSAFELIGETMSTEAWGALRKAACDLLRSRGSDLAAEILTDTAFDLVDATNFWGDEFSVLHLDAALDQYVEFSKQKDDPRTSKAYTEIARVLNEIGPYVRFIAVQLNTGSGPAHVPTPALQVTSAAVERALADAKQLIQATGASSGVDRVHTALHGYLLALCEPLPETPPADAGITQLLKFLRKHHPSLQPRGPRTPDIERILNSFAAVVDALNPVRNQASGAHPNAIVLDEPEAMLVINAVRTLLSYIDQKVQ